MTEGVRRHRNRLRVYVKVGEIQREHRFPLTASKKTIKYWLNETRVELRKRRPAKAERGSFAADVDRYLALVKAMPTYEERERHLALWTTALGATTLRIHVTAEQIRKVLHEWRAAGLEAATCNKRRTALMHLYSVLDGKSAANPVRDVPKFSVPDPLPRGRDYRALRLALEAMVPSKTKARLLVMFWTGMRPVEVMRAQPEDVNTKHRFIVIRTAKHGRARTVPLTRAAVQAWQEFDRLEAWGAFTLAPMNRMLQKACAMADVKVYDLRHSFATALVRQKVPLTVLAALLGHSTLDLTRRYTLAAVPPEGRTAALRLARAAGKAAKTNQTA